MDVDSGREFEIERTVEKIFSRVQRDGDLALRQLTLEFDGADLASTRVRPEEFPSESGLSEFDQLVWRMIERVSTFHQKTKISSFQYTAASNAKIESRAIPYESIGLYVPGGKSALISSLVMLAVPALLAEVPRVVVCTPPSREGRLSPLLLRACELLGLTEVHKIGGAQAIASLAIGTESVKQVEKIFGPGNEYVTSAKRRAQSRPWRRAVDMVAGPSELIAIVDADQDVGLVATELMTQVEHGATSWALALTLSDQVATAISSVINRAVDQGVLPSDQRERIRIERCLSRVDLSARVQELAPEHLALYVKDQSDWNDCIASSGAVYIGPYISVVFGDYGIGPNHTLPTGGSAKRSSGLSVRDFQKTVTIVSSVKPIDQNFINDVVRLAEIEKMDLHAKAAKDRMLYE